jgi:hypothetical protein
MQMRISGIELSHDRWPLPGLRCLCSRFPLWVAEVASDGARLAVRKARTPSLLVDSAEIAGSIRT